MSDARMARRRVRKENWRRRTRDNQLRTCRICEKEIQSASHIPSVCAPCVKTNEHKKTKRKAARGEE